MRPAAPRRGRPPRVPRPADAAPAAAALRPGWTPSLTAAQQQALLTQCMQLCQARSQPSFTPFHALLQMGCLYLPHAQLPALPSASVGDGVVLRLDEARALGVLPPTLAAQLPGAPAAAPAPTAAPAAAWRPPADARPAPAPAPAAAPLQQLRTWPALPRPRAGVPLVDGGVPPMTNAAGQLVTVHNTRLTRVDDGFRPLSHENEKTLRHVMDKDAQFQASLTRQRETMDAELVSRVQTLMAPAPTPWWAVSALPDAPRPAAASVQLVYPAQRARGDAARRLARASKALRLARESPAVSATASLVPVRLELEHEPHKLRDTFLWNAHEDERALDLFAAALCEDYGVPAPIFVDLIKAAVQAQVQDHAAASALQATWLPAHEDGAGRGTLTRADEDAWAQWRGSSRQARAAATGAAVERAAAPARAADNDDTQRDHTRSELAAPDGASMAPTAPREAAAAPAAAATAAPASPASPLLPTPYDLRVVIKLDILVGHLQLLDQFEWDITADDATAAESFAHGLTADLGLGGEFTTAVAHAIREQVSHHLRWLALQGFPFQPLAGWGDEARATLLVAPAAWVGKRKRDAVDAYTPQLVQHHGADVVAMEREHERESRRKRRQTKGRRGAHVVDLAPLRTMRSVPLYGFAGALPDERPAPGSRRAAAAAAAANLAALAHDAAEESSLKKVRHDSVEMAFRYPAGRPVAPPPAAPRFRAAQSAVQGRRLGVDAAAAPYTTGAWLDDARRSRAESRAPPPPPPPPTAPARSVRPEDLERQHPTMHDGVWHCAHCGLPGFLDTARRKGPAGEKTLCGPCGKYYHRHRRMPTVVYTRDVEYHRRRLGVAASRVPAPGDAAEDDGAPLTSESDDDHAAGDAPPAWLTAALHTCRARYPLDRFHAQRRVRTPDMPDDRDDWRIRCEDCPGKVYKPGPGESLANFEIHLKNRSHRANVARRTEPGVP